MKGGAPVTLRLRGRDIRGMTKPIAENKQTIATELSAQLMQSPFDAKFYDVTFDESGNPIKEEIDQAVETAVMIQVKLN